MKLKNFALSTFIFVLLCSFAAFAVDDDKTPTVSPTVTATNNSNTSKSDSNANSASISGAKATGGDATSVSVAQGGQGGQGGKGGNAVQGQQQGQQQSSTSSASNGAQSNTQVSNVTTPHQAPSVSASAAYPSAPCRVSSSIGGSAPLGGLSFGSSKLDDQCDKRETARAFAVIGDTQAAHEILCTTKAAKNIASCKK